jgi:hypothetical protein
MEFLFAAYNLAFTVALALLMLLVLLELGMGGGMTEYLDTLLPDLELGADGHPLPTESLPTRLLGWLRRGRVPMLMLFVVFLGVYGTGGLLMQYGWQSLGFAPLPGWIAAAAMLLLALPVTRLMAAVLGGLLPRDETQVISERTLIGRFAVIVLGSARRGSPAQAKLRDEFRTTHYLMVEPAHDHEVFNQGDEVLLTARHGAHWRAVKVEVPAIDKPR